MDIAVSPDILKIWNSISFASGARPLYYPGNAAKHHAQGPSRGRGFFLFPWQKKEHSHV